ncbi:MAG: hypothetical protein ACLT2I_08300 [Corynebacterium variabile]|uniref:hypothetical protein n=1 Tax=Corynebacterium variabile TaxID=1727 RepID=UPI002FDFCD0C
MTIYTAAGAGQSYKTLLTNLGSGLEDQGMTVTCDEVAPTTEDDPNASGLSVLALPLAFGGMISAALLSLTMKKRYSLRVIGSLSFSVMQASSSARSSSSASVPSTRTTGNSPSSWPWVSVAHRCSSSDWSPSSATPDWGSEQC